MDPPNPPQTPSGKVLSLGYVIVNKHPSIHHKHDHIPGPSCRGVLAGLPYLYLYRSPDRAPGQEVLHATNHTRSHASRIWLFTGYCCSPNQKDRRTGEGSDLPICQARSAELQAVRWNCRNRPNQHAEQRPVTTGFVRSQRHHHHLC